MDAMHSAGPITSATRLDILKATPLLSDLNHLELEMLKGCLHERLIPDGEQLLVEGASASHVFWLAMGSVHVIVQGEIVALVDTVQCFGEMSCSLPDGRCTATVVAVGSCKILAIEKAEFLTVLASVPKLWRSLFVQSSDRLSRTNKRLSEVLAHVPQGFMKLDRAARVTQEYSEKCLRYFDVHDLVGCSLLSLLEIHEPAQVKVWMDVYGMLFSNPVLPFEDLTRLLTREHRVEKNGRVRDLLLTYHASRNLAGEIDAIDVGIEDVTELRQLELANTALHYEQAVLGRIYSDPESFVELLELMTDVLDDCQELLVRLDELNSDATAIAIETCIRSVHSLKGLSSVFGFEPVQQCCDQIVSMVRRLKSQCAEVSLLSARSVIPDFKKQLKDSLNLLHDQQEHARGLQDKIGNDLLKRLKGVVLPETEFETLRACLKSGKIHEAIRIIDSAQERDALELFNNWDVKVDLMARTLKKVVRFERKGAGGTIPKDLFFALSNVLINVMNNSLDHGIERPDERLALGKPREGYLLAQAVVHTGFLELEVSDDGQGIDFAQLPALAKSLPELDMDEITAIESSGELWRILLLPGFTTAAMVTRYSGYGEGLSFLNLIVLAQQGTVRVESRVGHGLTVSLRIPLNAT